jgi:hypothetical protein
MNFDDLNNLYVKFWDVLDQTRDELYNNYFMNLNNELQKSTEIQRIKTIDNFASLKSLSTNNFENQINLYFKKIQTSSQHLLTALLHVYLKLCAIQNEKNQKISIFCKTIAHDSRLSIEYEIKKSKEIMKSLDSKVLKLYKESFEKLMHQDYRELKRRSACIISRSDIFLSEIFSKKEDSYETTTLFNVNDETTWNSNVALKNLIEKKSKIQEILYAPIKKCANIVLHNVSVNPESKQDQLSILLILLQKYKVEKERQHWLQTLHANPEQLSEKLVQLRTTMNQLDKDLELKNNSSSVKISHTSTALINDEQSENEKIHCLIVEALKEIMTELEMLIDDLHIFSIQCSHILKKIQYQVKSEIKMELVALKNIQRKKILYFRESMQKSTFLTDVETTHSQKLLEDSLECILNECDTIEFQNNQEIKLCVECIKNLYDHQLIIKCNEILKNNNEFLLSIANSLIQQIKLN